MSRSAAERRATDRAASGQSARSSARLSGQLEGPLLDGLPENVTERPVRERRERDVASSTSGRTHERTRRERTERSDRTGRASVRKRAARTPSPELDAAASVRTVIRDVQLTLPIIKIAHLDASPYATCTSINHHTAFADAPSLSEMTAEEQEAAMIEDLLYVLLGCPGAYVNLDSTKTGDGALANPRHSVSKDLDPSLRDVTEELLRVAGHYIAVNDFIDMCAQTSYGTVNNALTASMRAQLDPYLVLVAQLEQEYAISSTFSLHSLALHLRPMAQIVQVLYDLVQDFAPKASATDTVVDEYGEENMQDILNQLQMGNAFTSLTKAPKMIKGGAVLQLVTARARLLSGDPSSRAILGQLLRDASVPYTKMINLWIHQGAIVDPHDEFLIKEQSNILKEKLDEDYTSEYWEKRYTIRKDDTPQQLDEVTEKILLAGKYLNVVRECSNVDTRNAMTGAALPTSFDDAGFTANIERAYTTANSALLALLLSKHELQLRLESMKHFFFLSQADFFAGFTFHAAIELAKVTKLVQLDKVQSFFDVYASLPGTITNQDKYKDDIRVTLSNDLLLDLLNEINNTQGLGEDALVTGTFTDPVSSLDKEDGSKKSISGNQGLQLDVTVPFPISLVISRKAIFRYQLLFRHLYSLRHTEETLNAGWLECSKTHAWRTRSTSLQIERWKTRVWTLRARMLGFTTQISYYCTAEVIEPRFAQFMAKLSQVETVDTLMQDHVDFLDTCIKECMLTNQKLLNTYAKLLKACIAFASYIPQLSKHLEQADSALKADVRALTNGAATRLRQSPRREALHPVMGHIDEAHFAAMDAKLASYERHFERLLKVLLDTLNYYAGTETISLLSLMMRLDWNKGFRDDVLDP